MRVWLALIGVIALAPGCTHLQLARSTIHQGSTITNVQYQQVLDNLAMFTCNRDALVRHLKLSGGLVQVSDQGSGTVLANTISQSQLTPSLNALRGIVEQWNVDPTVDANELEMLQLAYLHVVEPGNPEVIHAVYEQICELAVTTRIPLAEQAAEALIANMIQWQPEREAELIGIRDSLREHYKALSTSYVALRTADARKVEIERLFDQLQHKYGIPEHELHALRDELDESWDGLNAAQVSNYGAAAHRIEEPVKQAIVSLTTRICELPYIPMYPDDRRSDRNVSVVSQAQDQIASLMKLIETNEEGAEGEFVAPWLCRGGKKDVPADACYVGHYCDCYVWVPRSEFKRLRDFTLIILTLAPPQEQDFMPGAAFSPTTG